MFSSQMRRTVIPILLNLEDRISRCDFLGNKATGAGAGSGAVLLFLYLMEEIK